MLTPGRNLWRPLFEAAAIFSHNVLAFILVAILAVTTYALASWRTR